MVCHENECKKRAYYAQKYDDKPTYCSEHGKKRGFINVHIKRCIECKIIATYGVRGERPNYCAKHGKERGLTNIVSKLCACLLYTSPSPRDRQKSRMPSSA